MMSRRTRRVVSSSTLENDDEKASNCKGPESSESQAEMEYLNDCTTAFQGSYQGTHLPSVLLNYIPWNPAEMTSRYHKYNEGHYIVVSLFLLGVFRPRCC